jgi:hypothetical protein
MGYIYIASPYSSQDPAVVEDRFEAVAQFVAKFCREGRALYSPILHFHPLSRMCQLPGDYFFWEKVNHAMIKAADELWILKLPGWDQSTGVRLEIEYAVSKDMPVRYVDLSGALSETP